MRFNTSDVKRLTDMSLIKLSTKDQEQLATDLNNIMKFIKIIEQYDSENINNAKNKTNPTQRLRSDQITESNQIKNLHSTNVNTHNGFYLVPKVIE